MAGLDLRNCTKCGKMFSYVGFGPEICDACRREDDASLEKVSAYLQEHPGANLSQVAAGTGIREAQILKWLREERLMLGGNGGATTGFLKCEKCGEPISTGRYCMKCKAELSRSLATMREEEASENGRTVIREDKPRNNRMRFLGKRK